MKVLNDGLEEDVMMALLLIEALHHEAERLTRTAASRAKPQDGAPVPGPELL
ncbi:hypothetical protein ABZ297_24100 [Nonomuraea sp. NPDC005983]|uniref:hypothetical protein n=1 Tax=Nonomuraea sp. NPDC005983 TaxID=3155595 RepID=UPI0033B9D2C6